MNQSISLPDSKPYEVPEAFMPGLQRARLIHVSDRLPGIRRIRKGKGFIYVLNGKRITKTDTLNRIRSIVIPPAWENVWICAIENGHIQATGFDTKQRKQYKYHPEWNSMRNESKFGRLLLFGEKLPQIRSLLEKDLTRPGLDQRKVLALILRLMERTFIRIGNTGYEKLYGSYGLTTLKDQHVKIDGSDLRFSFTGKKGVRQDISLKDRRLAGMVKQCREIPGKELFQYYDENGVRHTIDSGDVNQYLQEIAGEEFTAKDFRTWAGTLHALCALRQAGDAKPGAQCRKRITEALTYVSKALGNTATVCRKYYVHPVVISLYESNLLNKYAVLGKRKEERPEDERILMKILRKTQA